MLSQALSLLVQAGVGENPITSQEGYDSVSQLIKLGFLFIVILVLARLVILLIRRSQQSRESDAKLLNMRHDMEKIAKEKIANRDGNSGHLDEVR